MFGLSPVVYGAHADYLCLHERAAIAAMPTDVDFDEAVVCEGAWYADRTTRPARRLAPTQSAESTVFKIGHGQARG